MSFFKEWFTFKIKNPPQNEASSSVSFLDLLNCGDEFIFEYNNVKYEIVRGDGNCPTLEGLALYLSDCEQGTFIKSFKSNEDFLNNAVLEDKPISEIIDDIK